MPWRNWWKEKSVTDPCGPQRRAWRTYGAAAIAGMVATTTHDEIPTLCHMAAEIADEMVRREAERAETEGDA